MSIDYLNFDMLSNSILFNANLRYYEKCLIYISNSKENKTALTIKHADNFF